MGKGRLRTIPGPPATGAYVTQLTYTPNSNIATAADPFNGSWGYSYDNLNRLVSATHTNYEGSSYYTNGGKVALQCWNYDNYGNRTFELDVFTNGTPTTCPGTLTQATSTHTLGYTSGSTNNQATSLDGNPIAYDVAGNVISDALNNYIYDVEGRLCAVQNKMTFAATQYVYDAAVIVWPKERSPHGRPPAPAWHRPLRTALP